MRHWSALLLAVTAFAATDVTNQVPGAMGEFGAAAIRNAAGGVSLGTGGDLRDARI